MQQHKIVRSSSHNKHLVKCVSIDPDDSPSVDNSSKMYSESLRRLRSGETGCISVCGTQPKDAVDVCLRQTYTPPYSFEDDQHCESLGQFKSEDALRSDYMDEARRGLFCHERTWRGDQKFKTGGECKKPMQGNYNPYPSDKIDRRAYFGDHPRKFISDGADLKKGCRSPILHKEYQQGFQESLICRDNPVDKPCTPNIEAINNDELIMGLKELSKLLSADENQKCPLEE